MSSGMARTFGPHGIQQSTDTMNGKTTDKHGTQIRLPTRVLLSPWPATCMPATKYPMAKLFNKKHLSELRIANEV